VTVNDKYTKTWPRRLPSNLRSLKVRWLTRQATFSVIKRQTKSNCKTLAKSFLKLRLKSLHYNLDTSEFQILKSWSRQTSVRHQKWVRLIKLTTLLLLLTHLLHLSIAKREKTCSKPLEGASIASYNTTMWSRPWSSTAKRLVENTVLCPR
jgi:hypothetical protein